MTDLKAFSVLDRAEDIYRNRLLEASAGTGKTFSIENLFVRFLMTSLEDEEPPQLEEILVVTFTRAATRELFERIRSKVQFSAAQLQAYLDGDEPEAQSPDYLMEVIEGGQEVVVRALRRLEDALYCFDASQIYTIHGFCARLLRDRGWEGGMGAAFSLEAEPIDKLLLTGIVRDFMRTELSEEELSLTQLKILLSSRMGDGERLIMDLADLATGRYDLPLGKSFSQLYQEFCVAMTVLKGTGLTQEQLLHDFELLGPTFKGISTRGKLKEEVCSSLKHFAGYLGQGSWSITDFDWVLRDGMSWMDTLIHGERYVKAATDLALQAPDFAAAIMSPLAPILKQGRDPTYLIAHLGALVQSFVSEILKKRCLFGPDQLLTCMDQAVRDPAVAAELRSLYRVAVIDEFQDTDPTQWRIFKTLFLYPAWKGVLYLVGDPKQSIYRFRSADIYTYLQAGNALGEGSLASLDTNYRSQAPLVEALNALFSPVNCPGWIALPRSQESLPFHPVKAGGRVEERDFSDSKGLVHFFRASASLAPTASTWPPVDMEDRALFPFIASEIAQLQQEDGIRFADQAILVRDHRQGERLRRYLEGLGIPCLARRGESLANSSARRVLRDLVQAVLNPSDLSAVKALLGGSFCAWSDDDLIASEQSGRLGEVLYQIHGLRSVLYREGFGALWMAFQKLRLAAGEQTGVELLLQRPEGVALWAACQQGAELLMQEEARESAHPGSLVQFIDSWDQLALNSDERLLIRQDPTVDAVQIMTIHVSKGLEFQIVYALGLARRTPIHNGLLPCLRGDKELLLPVEQGSEDAVRHAEEEDAEKMRQLYVAMTRAKYRLYVPLLDEQSGRPAALGSASAMELFSARYARAACTHPELYQRLDAILHAPLINFLEVQGSGLRMTWSWAHEAVPPRLEGSVLERESFDEPLEVKVTSKAVPLLSFSALAHSQRDVLMVTDPPHDYSAEKKTAGTLPAGSHTGVLLHALFEDIPLGQISSWTNAEYLEFVRPYCKGTRLEKWEEVLAQQVYAGLHTPLGDAGFCVADIKPAQMRRELDFLYHLPEGGFKAIHGEAYVRGIMDLFFEHQGKYYLLDWKSNWLGSEPSDYSPEAMHGEMNRHQYTLQADLYVEALQRYLKWVDPRPFSECFGGVYYIFLRGLNGDGRFGVAELPFQNYLGLSL